MDKLYRLRIVTKDMNTFEGLTHLDVGQIRSIIRQATDLNLFAQIPCVDETGESVSLDIHAPSIQGILHLEFHPAQASRIARPNLAVQ